MHPKHPKCKECGRALYKVRNKGSPPSKKIDKWRWCRNKDCGLFNYDHVKNRFIKPKKGEKEHKKESEVVSEIRKEIRQKIDNIPDLTVYILTLVIISQELGEYEIANKLIERYSLDEVYEIEMRGKNE